jgi:hypothetical protein
VWLHWVVPGTCIAQYEQSESRLNEAESDMPTFIMVGSLYVGRDKGLGAVMVSFRFVVLCNQ